MRVLGIDGWRGGWVYAEWRDTSLTVGTSPTIAPLLTDSDSVIAVDMPIGLPATGGRVCDHEAKRRLGAAHARVFLTPPRVCLDVLDDHAEAVRRARTAGGHAPSAQAFGLLRKVAELDAALDTAADPDHVVEAHPELSFLALTGAVLPSKRHAAGVARRISALDAVLPASAALAALREPVPVDDALDAVVLAWTARRYADGSATVLGDGTRDERGRPMRIVT